ncbi:MAG: hypothetical protein U0R23_12030 [Candidatus Nanopelagicales bacterium]
MMMKLRMVIGTALASSRAISCFRCASNLAPPITAQVATTTCTPLRSLAAADNKVMSTAIKKVTSKGVIEYRSAPVAVTSGGRPVRWITGSRGCCMVR